MHSSSNIHWTFGVYAWLAEFKAQLYDITNYLICNSFPQARWSNKFRSTDFSHAEKRLCLDSTLQGQVSLEQPFYKKLFFLSIRHAEWSTFIWRAQSVSRNECKVKLNSTSPYAKGISQRSNEKFRLLSWHMCHKNQEKLDWETCQMTICF